jgi:hypothetical protein
MAAKSGPKGFTQKTGRPSVPKGVPEGFKRGGKSGSKMSGVSNKGKK